MMDFDLLICPNLYSSLVISCILQNFLPQRIKPKQKSKNKLTSKKQTKRRPQNKHYSGMIFLKKFIFIKVKSRKYISSIICTFSTMRANTLVLMGPTTSPLGSQPGKSLSCSCRVGAGAGQGRPSTTDVLRKQAVRTILCIPRAGIGLCIVLLVPRQVLHLGGKSCTQTQVRSG